MAGPMTVGELIAELQQHDPADIVIIHVEEQDVTHHVESVDVGDGEVLLFASDPIDYE